MRMLLRGREIHECVKEAGEERRANEQGVCTPYCEGREQMRGVGAGSNAEHSLTASHSIREVSLFLVKQQAGKRYRCARCQRSPESL